MGDNKNCWEKLSEVKAGTEHQKVIIKKFKLPDGNINDYHIQDEGIVVAILAIDKNNKVILTEQFRPGPEELLYELPAGLCEPGEDPINAAERELKEETGYLGKLELVTRSYDDAYSNCIRYNFVATKCEKIQKQDLDEHEFINLKFMSLDEFREHMRSGNFTDIETAYLGLDYLELL